MLLMTFLVSLGADLLAQLPGLLGGGGIVLLAVEIRKAYAARVGERTKLAVLEDQRDIRENDDSRSFVTEAREERRSTLHKVEVQADEITRLSVEIAKCTAKHEAMELRDADKDRQLHQLSASLDMTQQLVTRQREEICAQERVIESQGRAIVGLHAQLDQLKAAFDAFVKRAMSIDDEGGMSPAE